MVPNPMLWKMIPNNLFRINIPDWENLLESEWKVESWRVGGGVLEGTLEEALELG